MESLTPSEREARFPTVHVVSDSVGVTARAVARAAAAQFGVTDPKIEVLPKVTSFEQIKTFLDNHKRYHVDNGADGKLLVFFTLVHSGIRDKVIEYAAADPDIVAVDLMTGAIDAISEISGMKPTSTPGSLREPNEAYFKRIEAMEFTIDHDDGRNPQDLLEADIVILGVSRSSKTPLSIYLAQEGLKVANIPLDPDTEVPHEIYDVDRTRLFGLMTTPEVLYDIRRRRLGNALGVAGEYADLEYIYKDLDSARALMRSLGCIIIRTDQRAVEETAQEILRYFERSHPIPTDIIE